MGLDQVELILNVEDVFGISISDEEAGEVRTVGDLHEIICTKLDVDGAPSAQSVNLLAFHRLRAGLMAAFSVPRKSIRRDARIEQLAPRTERRRRWQYLKAHTRLALPPLQRPNWLVSVLTALTLAVALGVYWLYGAVAAVSSSLIAAFVFAFVTRPLAVEVPAQCATVETTTRTLAGLSYGLLLQQTSSALRSEVWDTLVVVIHEQLAVPVSDIRPEAAFRVDLKVD